MRRSPRATTLAVAATLAIGVTPAVASLAAPTTGAAAPQAAALLATPLTSGVPVTASGAAGSWTYYTVTVPADATTLTVTTSGGPGDVDLYVRAGAQPTSSAYTCRPYKTGNTESCTVHVTPGTYHIGLYGYASFSGITLKATHNGSAATSTTTSAPSTSQGGNVLTNGAATTVSGASKSWTYYRVDAPAGASDLRVATSGGTGDVDLFLRYGSQPTASAYDCRPYQSGNAESCSLAAPKAGTYWVGLNGYSSFSGVTLKATWTGGTGTSDPTTSTSKPTVTTPTTSGPSSTTASPTSPTPTPGDTLPSGPWGSDLSLARSNPKEDTKYPAKSNPEIDALRYHLDLDWNGSTLNGRTTLVFRAPQATSKVRLDLGTPLAVSKVTLDGQTVSSSRDTEGLVISTGSLAADSQHTLVITYAGAPAGVKMPSGRGDVGLLGWVTDTSGNVSTMQEPYGAFTWFPSNDIAWDKAYYTATITAPAGKQGVFNGQLTNTTSVNGRTVNTFVLDKPAAPYLTTLAIGPYMKETRTLEGGTPFNLWYTSQDTGNLSTIWNMVNKGWGWTRSNLAPYPFASHGMVIVGKGSAMETQTMLTINRKYSTNTDVFVHETAHQWNGDSVTTWDWKDLWLNEGWAMYWEDEFKGGVSDDSLGNACQSSTSTAGPAGDFDPNSFGEGNVYVCGARALREIRNHVGASSFTTMAKGWQESKKYQNATRADFIAHVKSTTGYDPTADLDNWLGSNPH